MRDIADLVGIEKGKGRCGRRTRRRLVLVDGSGGVSERDCQVEEGSGGCRMWTWGLVGDLGTGRWLFVVVQWLLTLRSRC